MSNIYIISDTHWYHDNVILFTNRPDNHNELMTANWKATVQENDIVFHLGDVCFDPSIDLKVFLDKLPGRKILVQGNHDRKSLHWYMQNGFDFACEKMIFKNILFSHKPMILPDKVEWNVHGHFHTASVERWEPDLKSVLTPKHRMFVIESPAVNYTPVRWERFFSKKFDHFNTLKIVEREEKEKEE